MVYRRVVMVRLILMFMLRYFWVSEGAGKVDGLVGFLLHDADDFWVNDRWLQIVVTEARS